MSEPSIDFSAEDEIELRDLLEKETKKKEEKEEEKEDPKSFFLNGKKLSKSSRKVAHSKMTTLLSNNVVEIVFKRRVWPIKVRDGGQQNPYRRMMATANWKYLSSEKSIFKFKAPGGSRSRSKKWYKNKGLIIVQDLIRQNWRMISLDEYDIIKVISVKTKEQQKEFTDHYARLYKKHGKKKLIDFFNK